MNYISLRYIVKFIIISIVSLVYLSLIKKYTRKKIVILIILLLIINRVISVVPFEKYFIKFNTLEEAFNYSYRGCQIMQVIERDEYAFVIYHSNSGTTRQYTHFIKNNEKWEVKSPNESCTKIKATPKGFTIVTNKIKQKNVMFVCIGYPDTLYNNPDINDSINSDFILEKENELIEYNYYSKTAIIDNVPEDYYLIIEGEKIEI